MTDKSSKTPPNKEDLQNLVENASKKLNVDIDWVRSITAEEIIWLLDHCPFLQVVNSSATFEDKPVKFIEARSGWTIHDYGDALSSSPGKFLLGGGNFKIILKEDDEGGEGGSGRILNPGKGTLRNQAYVTAMQMAEIAFQRKWRGMRIVDGHPMMERAAWIRAEELGVKVEGFKPSESDRKVRDRVRMSAAELDELRRTIRAGQTPSETTKKQPR